MTYFLIEIMFGYWADDSHVAAEIYFGNVGSYYRTWLLGFILLPYLKDATYSEEYSLHMNRLYN